MALPAQFVPRGNPGLRANNARFFRERLGSELPPDGYVAIDAQFRGPGGTDVAPEVAIFSVDPRCERCASTSGVPFLNSASKTELPTCRV